MHHYRTIHCMTSDVDNVEFPDLSNTPEDKVIYMMHNIKKGKALALDGISDQLFSIKRDKCKKTTDYCATCQKKIAFVKGFIQKEYW
jgi:hypothetical protein